MDVIPEKVKLINNRKSPNEYIEKYLAEKELDLTATLDVKKAYSAADFVVNSLITQLKDLGVIGAFLGFAVAGSLGLNSDFFRSMRVLLSRNRG